MKRWRQKSAAEYLLSTLFALRRAFAAGVVWKNVQAWFVFYPLGEIGNPKKLEEIEPYQDLNLLVCCSGLESDLVDVELALLLGTVAAVAGVHALLMHLVFVLQSRVLLLLCVIHVLLVKHMPNTFDVFFEYLENKQSINYL